MPSEKLQLAPDANGDRDHTMNDDLKLEILSRLNKNLTLEQLENVEALVKKTHFQDKNYNDFIG